MKLRLFFVIFLLLMLAELCLGQHIKTPNGFQIRTGVNLGLWLSSSEKRGLVREKFIVQSDFDTIKSIGFDHIRLPIDEVQFWDENGKKQHEAFNLMHNAINWAIENNLRLIVNLHIIRSHHFFKPESNTLWGNSQEQEKLVGLWKQLSAELHKYPIDYVAYELLNEPVAENHDDWNRLIDQLFNSIRKIEPERTLIFGSNRYQGVETFPALKVPEGDKNMILTFHYYHPFALTFYKIPWSVMKDYNGAVYYPGEVVPKMELEGYSNEYKEKIKWAIGYYDKNTMQEDINSAIKVASELKLPLYCGEYGVYPAAPKDAALRWYQDLTDIFRENNIAFCHWNYNADFPIVDDNSKPLHPLVDILTK
jgi:endoglucanase